MHGLTEMAGFWTSPVLPSPDASMARSRTFRWGEDGIAGVSDTHGRLNIAFAFWNEKE